MKKYPKYKDSGVEWIGEIPEGWDKKRLRNIGVMYGGLTGKSGDDFRRDEDDPTNKPFIPFTNICNNTYINKNELKLVSINENDNQNRVLKHDLFFMMTSENQEDVGKTSVLKDDLGEVYLNTFCKGFRITDSYVDPLFLNYLLNGKVYRELLSIEGNGFTRVNLRQDRVNEFIVLLPPLQEQQQIVTYLDHKTTLIDQIISNSKKKIELLKEKRLSLVQYIILNSQVPRNKLIFGVDVINRPISRSGNTQYNKVGLYNWGRGMFKYDEELGDELGDSEFSFIEEGDLILSGQFSWEGAVTLVDEKFHNCIASHRFHILNGKENLLLTEYLWAYFTSQEGHFLLDDNSVGSAGRNRPLNIGKLLKEKIPFPDLKTQQKIKEVVLMEHRLREYSEKLISLLKEYRQSLISEVVTGKIKIN